MKSAALVRLFRDLGNRVRLGLSLALLLAIVGISEAKAAIHVLTPEDLLGANLSQSLEIYLDKDRQKTIDQVSDPEFQGFSPIPSAQHSVGIFGGYVWLHFKIRQDFNESQRVLIDLNQQARRIDLFLREEGESKYKESAVGYFQSEVAPFQLASRSTTWQLDLKREKVQEIYLKLDMDQSYAVTLRVFDLGSFYLKERTQLYFGGVYFGIMFLLIVMNFVQFLQSRELPYFLYALTLSILHVPVMGATLYGTEFLGFRFTFAEGRHLILLKMLGVMCMTIFTRKIIVGPENKKIDRIFRGLIWTQIPFIIGWFFVRPLAGWHALFNNLILLVLVFTLFVVAYRIKQRYRPAFIFGMSILPIAVVSISAIFLQVIKMPYLMPNLAIIFPSCLIFQVVALAYAVIDKVRVLQEQKEREAAIYQKEILALNSSLEQKVAEQTQEIRTMLENTHLGLLSVGQQLAIHKDYSRHLEKLLETEQIGGKSLWTILLSKVETGSDKQDMFRCALEYSIGEEAMFFEANAAMLPAQIQVRFDSGSKVFDCDWSPILDKDGRVERVLLGLSDVTEKLRLEQKAEEDRLRLQCLAEILSRGTVTYYKLESELKAICHELSQLEAILRSDCRSLYVRLHTLKSRARLVHYQEMTTLIHELEEHMHEEKPKQKIDVPALQLALERTYFVLGLYHQALTSIQSFKQESAEQQDVELTLQSLLSGFEDMVNGLCAELGKVPCLLQVDVADSIVLSPEVHEALYEAFLHLIRNTADHGLETPVERSTKGKSDKAHLHINIDSRGYLLIEDDGRGLALRKIESKARDRGLTFKDSASLANLVFESGFSTKEQVDQISGRGIGMDAVRSLLQAHGGDVWIELRGTPNSEGYVPFVTVVQIPQLQLDKKTAVA